jgi:hypothetical protein
MTTETPTIVWVIHWRYETGFRTEMGIIDRAFVSEDEARWQIKLLIDASVCGGQVYTLHSLPVHP